MLKRRKLKPEDIIRNTRECESAISSGLNFGLGILGIGNTDIQDELDEKIANYYFTQSENDEDNSLLSSSLNVTRYYAIEPYEFLNILWNFSFIPFTSIVTIIRYFANTELDKILFIKNITFLLNCVKLCFGEEFYEFIKSANTHIKTTNKFQEEKLERLLNFIIDIVIDAVNVGLIYYYNSVNKTIKMLGTTPQEKIDELKEVITHDLPEERKRKLQIKLEKIEKDNLDASSENKIAKENNDIQSNIAILVFIRNFLPYLRCSKILLRNLFLRILSVLKEFEQTETLASDSYIKHHKERRDAERTMNRHITTNGSFLFNMIKTSGTFLFKIIATSLESATREMYQKVNGLVDGNMEIFYPLLHSFIINNQKYIFQNIYYVIVNNEFVRTNELTFLRIIKILNHILVYSFGNETILDRIVEAFDRNEMDESREISTLDLIWGNIKNRLSTEDRSRVELYIHDESRIDIDDVQLFEILDCIIKIMNDIHINFSPLPNILINYIDYLDKRRSNDRYCIFYILIKIVREFNKYDDTHPIPDEMKLKPKGLFERTETKIVRDVAIPDEEERESFEKLMREGYRVNPRDLKMGREHNPNISVLGRLMGYNGGKTKRNTNKRRNKYKKTRRRFSRIKRLRL